jgi:16S rRNA processing protein RimM
MGMTPSWSDLVTIGELARSHGRRGEVFVNPLTDFPERFHELSRVFVEGDDGTVVPLHIESVREQGGRPVVKFRGVSDIGRAKELTGKEVRIPESELTPLPRGGFYHYQLVGCRVTDRKEGYLGVVDDVLVTGGTDVLVVRDSSGVERLIPLCKEICRSIETGEGKIEIEAPEGLVDLNAC